MGKSSVSKEHKIVAHKLENTQKRWLRKMARIVRQFPNDTYAAQALARGVHPVRKKPHKKIWTSRPVREYAHMLRVVGLNGKLALPALTRRMPLLNARGESDSSSEDTGA